MKPRQSALITLGAGAQQLAVIDAAQAEGLAVVAIDRDPSAPGLARAEFPVVCSTHATALVLNLLGELSQRVELSAIVARSTGPALETAARIRERFDLRGLTADVVRIATAKSALREFCTRRAIRVPRGACVLSADEVDAPLPLVVKPDYTIVGKRAIQRVDDRAQLHAAVQSAAAASRNGCAEVEEFIEGVDVSCAFWAVDGRAHFLTSYDELIGFDRERHLVPIGLSLPTRLDVAGADRIRSVVEAFARELPGVHALLFLCLRVPESGEPVVIELHADLAGDLIAEELFPAGLPAFEFFPSVVRFALTGELPDPIEPQPAAIVYRGPASAGALVHDTFELFQCGTIDENLSQVLADLRARGVDVAELPLGLRSLVSS